MAIFANTDAYVSVNSVDLSDHVVSVSWNETTDTVETVAMGDTAVQLKPTFSRGSISLEFQQDFAASNVYATLLAAKGTSITVAYRPTSAAASATNPERDTKFIVTEVPIIDGSIGEIATVSVTWPMDGSVINVTTS